MKTANLFHSRKNYENGISSMVLETFKIPRKKQRTFLNQKLLKENIKNIKNLEKQVEALEFKMNDLTNFNEKKGENNFKRSAEVDMIDRLFETIDHKFLKLDYLNYQDQSEELKDIDYFIKCLDHEIEYYESLLS